MYFYFEGNFINIDCHSAFYWLGTFSLLHISCQRHSFSMTYLFQSYILFPSHLLTVTKLNWNWIPIISSMICDKRNIKILHLIAPPSSVCVCVCGGVVLCINVCADYFWVSVESSLEKRINLLYLSKSNTSWCLSKIH